MESSQSDARRLVVLTGQQAGADSAGASHTSCQSNLIVFLEYTPVTLATLAHESSKNNESRDKFPLALSDIERESHFIH